MSLRNIYYDEEELNNESELPEEGAIERVTSEEIREADSDTDEEDFKVDTKDTEFEGSHPIHSNDNRNPLAQDDSVYGGDSEDQEDRYESTSEGAYEPSSEGLYRSSAESRQRARKSRKNRAHKVTAERIGLIILGCAAAAVIAVYLAGCFYFNDHFAFHTSLNGTDVSRMTVEEVEASLASAASDYTLTITGRNNVTDTIKGSEISLRPAYDNSVASLIVSQNSYAWPKSLFTETEFTSHSTAIWDAAQLTSRIDGLAFFDPSNEVAPTDAAYELTSTGYEIIPENDGVMPDKQAITQVIEEALYAFSDHVELGDNCYETAAVKSDDADLVATVNELNKLASMTVTIEFGDSVETLDGSTLGTWIVLSGESDGTSNPSDSSDGSGTPAAAETSNESEGSGSSEAAGTSDSISSGQTETSGHAISYTLDQDKVSDYVEALADKYDTYGKDRTFRTTDGETVTVSGGNYGWLMNRDITTAGLISFLNAGESGTFEVTWTQEAAQHGDNDIGNSYCEVDLDDQHVWVYVDGRCVVSTDCVSGKAVDPDRRTPDGTYSIVYRKSPATLRGEGYESPVTYWMPFNRGIGFHDATWRSKFGGEIYLTSGSHGCINLPLDAASEVYDNVYSGMPVIVYGGMTSEEAQEYTGEHPQTADAASQTEDSSVTEGTVDEETRKAQEAAVIAQAIQNYVNQGMSQEDATAKVQQDLATQAADQAAAAQAAEEAQAQAEAAQSSDTQTDASQGTSAGTDSDGTAASGAADASPDSQ